MATQVKIDMQEGSYLQVGTLDSVLSQAVRSAIAYDDAGADLSLSAGYTAINNAASSTHPDDTTLPKQNVRVTKAGKKVMGRIFYKQRARVFGGSDDPFLVVDVDAFDSTIKWYSRWENGKKTEGDAPYPNGDGTRTWTDDGKELIADAWERPITLARITVRVSPNSSVFGVAMPLVGTTNAGVFPMGGKSFKPNTLRFRFGQRASFIDNNSANYNVAYEFMYRPDTWRGQYMENDALETKVYDLFNRASWPVFPT